MKILQGCDSNNITRWNKYMGIYTVVYHTCKMFQAMKNMSSWDATDLRWSGILPSNLFLPLEKAF